MQKKPCQFLPGDRAGRRVGRLRVIHGGLGSAMVDDLHGMEKTMTSQHYALSFAELRGEAEKLGNMTATDKPEADAMDRVAIALYEVGAVLAS